MQREFSDEFKRAYSNAKNIISEVKKVIVGKDEVILKLLIAMMAQGHILIEDVPGVGKTTLAVAFSKACSLVITECSLLRTFFPAM